ncbi:hypothetical protein KXV37_004960 [Aspergillus fumigatus]|nr:hypothetical protein KXX11_008753 [Aspergillus fumigatus]KAH2095599.1 hypothetical protein KXW86_002497 [Aspergillus fumigatus]KAH2228433.1 hypothetical protein KXV37_004960 [Aspergillus fumigatus]KAH2365127.1 hypothetical protein KXV62_006199 [Aspergillus fumigatus]KAH3240046.1 hypothetical protein KXW23_006681 [Aspergillus fumigatus]
MGSFGSFLVAYLIGGLTFIPLVLSLILLHAYLTFPRASPPSDHPDGPSPDSIQRPTDDQFSLKSGTDELAEKFQRTHESDVAAGYFAVCREYVPGGVNGKPPERTTPAGEVIAAESPSVYQTMYRSLFDRKQTPTIEPAKNNGKNGKRARNVFYIVLRHGHLMLYDDANQVEVRYVISLAHHDVSIYGGEGEILEGELWLKRNAICLSRRLDSLGDLGGPTPPFYLFSDNLTEKEDFYFAMLQNQTRMGDSPNCPPKHQQFDVKHIVTLVQRLHSSEEQLQTRWINAVLGRLFLALYKTPEVEDFIRQKITKKISRVNKPNFISKLCLQRIGMGEGAPFITNPRLKDLTVDGNCCVETDIQYTGNFRLEISATVRIDLGPRFKAREVDIVLAVVLKKLEGHMLIRFKPPPSNRVWVSFETMPNMVMDIEPIVSSKQITYGIILRTIESRIREVVAESVVQPYWDDIPFLDTASQPYRGGIWQREVPGQDSKAEIPDESISQPQTLTTKDSTEALKTKDDRAMSMPVLLETTAGLKSRKSSKLVTTDSETSISSAVDKTGGLSPPRAIRSQTFSNVADPVVTADNVKIEKATSDIKGEEKSSAASAMIEISNRSPPGSPNKTPNGSPPSISQMNPEKLSSSRGSSFMESIESVSEFASSSPTRPTSAHLASESSNALRGANGSSNASINSDRSRRRSTLETVGTLTRSVTSSTASEEKPKLSISLGTATAAAKKWSWSVFGKGDSNSQEISRPAGTPDEPIGRGHPLPPPGTPLPRPDKFGIKSNPIPRRKPVPPPLPGRSKGDAKRPVPKPPLPKRKPPARPEGDESSPDELLVVEAPYDSTPNSPAPDSSSEIGIVLPIATQANTRDLSRSGSDDVVASRRWDDGTEQKSSEHDSFGHGMPGVTKHGMEILSATDGILPYTEADLAINIRKATSIEETAPKRKHVRSCIVYTWDHKSSAAFWAGMKVQPVLADEVQTFKALITIHKVLQEGHPIVVREAQQHVNWIDSLMRGVGGDGIRGYGPLIREYVFFLESKLAFHRNHPEFNGLFEYEEYISLKTINDPNEGYETITDLMTLQDQIDTFQKLIFSHFQSGTNNECRISALVPLVQESYGIYKFITSMLRAMHTTTGDNEALEPLRGRYDAQHYRLVRFYYECSNLRYLTSLITVPKLPQDPPSLLAEDEDRPALPKRPTKEVEKQPSPPPKPVAAEPEPINDFWTNEAKRQQEEFEAEQRRLQQQWEEQQRQQLLAQQQAQREFEEQQRLQAEQQRLAQEQLLREQYQTQTQGRLAELERENLNARAQYERDQLMLQQYDRRVKDLEEQMAQLTTNLNMQNASKDEQIRALQEQVNTWRSKYEALAKLYSQLRQEHLDLLQTTKSLKLKAASAQEAIEKREKLERELKTKNLELADMIRERDRALHDRDRLTGTNKEELEKLKRELRLAIERAENAERSKGTEISTLLSKYNREMADLEEALRNKTRALEEISSRNMDRQGDHELALREKDEEIEVYKSGMEQALMELEELKLRTIQSQGDVDHALDSQIDTVLQGTVAKINDIIDSVLQTGVQRVDDALYELDSTMQAGNQNASPPYVLSQVEKASASATEFSTAFNNFIADGPNSPHAEIIRTVSIFSGSIADVLSNTKGLTRFANDDKSADQLLNAARKSAQATVRFFRGLQSFRLEGLEPLQKTDVVINNNLEVQKDLQSLSKLVDAFAPKSTKISTSGDLGDLVDKELSKAADAIEAAAARLAKLKTKPREGFSTYELRINDVILAAAIAVTNAIAELIKAATESQQEIVREGRGSSSRTAFYKKNNRWTEGLISAAKAVATSTNTLIETADGVISGRNSPEQLIVASNDVAASTAQLVAASRVKATFMSKTQDRLEAASKAVGAACRALVRQVQDIIAERNRDEGETVDYAKLSSHEFKVREMEQQVEILQLENSLARARQRLGEMRKISYQED